MRKNLVFVKGKDTMSVAVERKRVQSSIFTTAVLEAIALHDQYAQISPSSAGVKPLRDRAGEIAASLGEIVSSQSFLPGGFKQVIPGVVAEIASKRLSDRVGLGAAAVFVSETCPMRAVGHLRERSGLYVETLPFINAASIYHLQGIQRDKVYPESFNNSLPGLFEQIDESLYSTFNSSLEQPGPALPNWLPNYPMEQQYNQDLFASILWDGKERTRQHCFRALLGLNYCHAGISIVNVRGQLFSIDHSDVEWIDGTGDLSALHERVKNSPKVMEAARSIAALTSEDVEQSLSGIEPAFWESESEAMLREPGQAASYLVNRLSEFCRLFGSK